MPTTGPIVGSLQISRAYGVTVRPVAAPHPAGPSHGVRPDAPPTARAKPGAALLAATVPGRISFSGPAPAPETSALPMYRHPADRNAAATAVSAGRLLDITG